MANPNKTSRTGAEEVSSPAEIAAYLKSVYQPAVQPGKRPTELLWVTTTLTDHPVDDNLPRYKAWKQKLPSLSPSTSSTITQGSVTQALEGHTAEAS